MTGLNELLLQQDKLLDDMMLLLEEEFVLLKQRQALSLPDIASKKQLLLEQLQRNDASISQHPDQPQLNGPLSAQKEHLVEKLRQCQERNEVNGKLLELSLASNRRLSGVLSQIRDRNSMTYDSKGTAHAAGNMNLNLKA